MALGALGWCLDGLQTTHAAVQLPWGNHMPPMFRFPVQLLGPQPESRVGISGLGHGPGGPGSPRCKISPLAAAGFRDTRVLCFSPLCCICQDSGRTPRVWQTGPGTGLALLVPSCVPRASDNLLRRNVPGVLPGRAAALTMRCVKVPPRGLLLPRHHTRELLLPPPG